MGRRNFNNYSLMDIIEDFAASEGLISSEKELSEMFDEEVAPSVIEQYGEDDTIAMDEAFNNWTDALCEEGELHEEQYNSYTYVGKYS